MFGDGIEGGGSGERGGDQYHPHHDDCAGTVFVRIIVPCGNRIGFGPDNGSLDNVLFKP